MECFLQKFCLYSYNEIHLRIIAFLNPQTLSSMKKLLTIIAVCFGILMSTNSFAVVGAPTNSPQETVTQKSPSITIEDIKNLSAKEIEEKIGQKLNWKQKLAIKLTKNK